MVFAGCTLPLFLSSVTHLGYFDENEYMDEETGSQRTYRAGLTEQKDRLRLEL
jgi:hypothetical protein